MVDRVNDVPGLVGGLDSAVWSGYLRVTKSSSTSNLFYVFIEGPKGAPLIIFGQGGPGCSSMLGLFTEFGPWRPQRGGSLVPNPYSWSKVASLLFIDSPVGAGFSYESGVKTKLNDETSALDFVSAVDLFFHKYPEMESVVFHFASESYGGHFLMQWTDLVLNSEQFGHLAGRLQGIILGNPYVSWESSDLAYAHAVWGRQLVSKPLWDEFEQRGCSVFGGYSSFSYPAECQSLLLRVLSQKDSSTELESNLNPYNLIDPSCVSSQSQRVLQLGVAARSRGPDRSGGESLQSPSVSSVDVNSHYSDPCVELYLLAYLSRSDVKRALHVDDSGPESWIQCSDDVFYNWPTADSQADMTRLFRELMRSSAPPTLRILVFSGDADGVCPTIGTQQWIWESSRDRKVVSLWSPWYDESGQTGGFVTRFEHQATFATVHSAGHMVAASQPLRALSLVKGYLSGSDELFANATLIQVAGGRIQSAALYPQSSASESFSIAVVVVFLTAASLALFIAMAQRLGKGRG